MRSIRALTFSLLVLSAARPGGSLAQDPLPIDENIIVSAGEASAAPGEIAIIPIGMETLAGAPEIRGSTIVVKFDLEAFEFDWIEQPSRGGTFDLVVEDPEGLEQPGVLSMWTRYCASAEAPLSEPIRLRFWIRPEATEGVHPIEIVESGGSSYLRQTEVYTSAGNRSPVRLAGAITVAGTPPDPLVPYRRSEDYGWIKSVLDDRVVFRLGDITAAPGSTGITMPLTIDIAEGGPALESNRFWIEYDPAVLDSVSLTPAPGYPAQSAMYREGVQFALLQWSGPQEPISPPGGTAATLSFCVRTDAPPGVSPLHILEAASRFELFPPTAPPQCWEYGSTFSPLSQDGSVTVAGDPVPGGRCPPTPPDTTVTFALGEATAAPGETGIAIPLAIRTGPDAPPVSSWMAVIRYDPATLGEVVLASTQDVASSVFVGPPEETEAGKVTLTVACKDGEPIPPGSDLVVAEARFCVLGTAGAGPSAVEFDGDTIYTPDGGWHRTPNLIHGRVTVDGESVGDGCRPDGPPANVLAAFKLADAVIAPEGEFVVPFIMNGALPIQGFSFSLDFDEEVLEATGVEEKFAIIGDPCRLLPCAQPDIVAVIWNPDRFKKYHIDNSNLVPGDAGVDEGFVAGAVVFSPSKKVELPADQDNLVLALHFRVRPGVPDGTTTEIRFLDGALVPSDPGPMSLGEPFPVSNILTMGSASFAPGSEPGKVFVVRNGRVGINGDVSVFVRGDVDGENGLDITDAILLLGRLFLGGLPSTCADAEDANDDGVVDLSDAITVLGFLFQGGSVRIPPPTREEPGDDRTPDDLDCLLNRFLQYPYGR